MEPKIVPSRMNAAAKACLKLGVGALAGAAVASLGSAGTAEGQTNALYCMNDLGALQINNSVSRSSIRAANNDAYMALYNLRLDVEAGNLTMDPRVLDLERRITRRWLNKADYTCW